MILSAKNDFSFKTHILDAIMQHIKHLNIKPFMQKPIKNPKEIQSTICKRLAKGESLVAICKDKNMPSREMVYRWLADDKEFVDSYARARETQAEHYLDEIIQIADNCTDDIEKLKDSQGADKEGIKHSAIQRARLQIDARKWTMSKLAPKKYGDRAAIDLEGKLETSGKTEIVVTRRDFRGMWSDADQES